ncbi:hypothetical protein [Clostridium sp.]|uniref:hypothetical protein n=1 Tax=Clostridium sp. TaxID=1506 RepID=UPI00260CE603|nr:hypothetical protein [Clostridium sp.]
MDNELEKKIKEELNSDYWQKVINYKGFSCNCDLEILDCQADISTLEVVCYVRYKSATFPVRIKAIDFQRHRFGAFKDIPAIVIRTKIAEEIIKQQLNYYNGELPVCEKHAKGNEKMQKLFIETTNGSLSLEGVALRDIQVDSYDNGIAIMKFGDKAAINLDHFVSYEFAEEK